ncbi:hypothetical protein [Sphaerisporangium perillae]|uniref:hypothetical protein n=1 Tax=Sphaerisporangium perillae TaxID=2935860 RepID=UPI00200CEB3E|nr:hypothetical protein [Sphaerisporangium perillae]
MIDNRAALISGLRDLADFLDTNPDIPTPSPEVTAYYFPDRAADYQMCTDIDKVAAYLGSEIEADHPHSGHCGTSIRFGPVAYRAVAVLAERRAGYQAECSYEGCVIPDDRPVDGYV